MSEAFVQRVCRRVDDIARRIEIGFADLEVNDVATLRLQRFRLHQHFERSFSAETRHARGEAEFALCGFMHRGEQRLCADEVFSHLSTINTHPRETGIIAWWQFVFLTNVSLFSSRELWG